MWYHSSATDHMDNERANDLLKKVSEFVKEDSPKREQAVAILGTPGVMTLLKTYASMSGYDPKEVEPSVVSGFMLGVMCTMSDLVVRSIMEKPVK